MVKLIIEGDPVGKGRPRASAIGGKARLYTPAKTVAYEARVKAVAHAAMCGQPPCPAAIEAEIWVMVAPPASWPKKKQRMALEGDMLPTSKPDVDNVSKAILDACNGIVYADDRQITDLIVRRRYAAKSATLVYFRTKGNGC
jgi:Holliday junction resolvase RusA-like endonuclease